jgi:hypothetical protein
VQFSIDGYHFRVLTEGCLEDRAIIELLDSSDQWCPLGVAGLLDGRSVWIPAD